MLETLKNIIDNDNAISVIGFFITIIVAFITSFLTTKSNQKKTTSEYFKKEGIKIQERLLEFWSGLLVFDFETNIKNYINSAKLSKNLNNQEIVKIVQKESILYSSKSTIKAIGTYQQYSYKNKRKGKSLINEKSDIRLVQSMIVALRVTKRMKYDFTGERLSELDFIKIRINDLNFKKIFLARYFIIYYYIKEQFVKIILLLVIFTILFILFKNIGI